MLCEKEESNSLNNEKDIVHELQVEDILEDDELNNSSRGAGEQANFAQSEQQPVTSTVLETQVRPIGSTSQTGGQNWSDRSPLRNQPQMP